MTDKCFENEKEVKEFIINLPLGPKQIMKQVDNIFKNGKPMSDYEKMIFKLKLSIVDNIGNSLTDKFLYEIIQLDKFDTNQVKAIQKSYALIIDSIVKIIMTNDNE